MGLDGLNLENRVQLGVASRRSIVTTRLLYKMGALGCLKENVYSEQY